MSGEGEAITLGQARGPSAVGRLRVGGVPRSALAIYAHPDDADVSCGGTLATWAKAGCQVTLVVCTKGEKGTTSPSVDTEALAAQRASEMAAAAKVLGVADLRALGYPDGEVENDRELRRKLVRVVREVRPEVVLCPDPTAFVFGERYVNHRDHRVVGAAALDAVAPAAGRPAYFPEAGAPHEVPEVLLSGTLQPTVWVEVADGLAAKVEAVGCHRSQLGDEGAWVGEVVRRRAGEEGRAAGLSAAEAFRQVLLSW